MTIQETIAHPPIASNDEWLAARKELLQREKEAPRAQDAVSAARRRLPMVKVEKDYTFTGPDGEVTLLDLFEGRRQLIIYHFMFDPRWTKGCDGCTSWVDALGDLSALAANDTSFALVSRAPLPKLEAYKTQRGWDRPWYSSYGSDFNYDFHATLDASVAPIVYNYRTAEELTAMGSPPDTDGSSESHGLSVFFRLDDEMFHTYSSYARGCESLVHSSALLDVTPYGRQEDWEDSPSGWPQHPTYG